MLIYGISLKQGIDWDAIDALSVREYPRSVRRFEKILEW